MLLLLLLLLLSLLLFLRSLGLFHEANVAFERFYVLLKKLREGS